MHRVFAAAACVTAAFALWFFNRSPSLSTASGNHAADPHLKARDEKWAPNDSVWRHALQALEDENWVDASAAYHRARSGPSAPRTPRFVETTEAEREPSTESGRLLDPNESAFRDAYLQSIDSMFAALARGDLSPTEAKESFALCSQLGFHEPLRRFRREQPRIAAQRTQAAGRWLRVVFEPAAQHYMACIAAGLRQRFTNTTGLKLVFGAPLSRAEHQATWKRLNVDVTVLPASERTGSSPQPPSAITQPSIPEAISVRFELTGSEWILTSWDKLAPVVAMVEIPVHLRAGLGAVFKDTSGRPLPDAERIAKTMHQTLRVRLQEELGRIPRFQVFPGTEPAPLSAVSQGRLEVQNARVLAYRIPDQLDHELLIAARNPSPELRDALMHFSIDQALETLGPWVAGELPKLHLERRETVIRQLAQKPWYGNFQPILASLASATNEFPHQALRSLSGFMHLPELIHAVAELSCRGPRAFRPQYGVFLVQETPDTIFDVVWVHWWSEVEDAVAQRAFIALARQDPGRAMTTTMRVFDRCGPATQAQMMASFEFQSDRHGAAEVALLLRAAESSTGSEARFHAAESVKKASHVPELWNALQSMASRETDPKQRLIMEELLLRQVARAHPKQARQYQFAQLRSSLRPLRHCAVRLLLGSDAPKAEVLSEIRRLLAASPNDITLLASTIECIRQYHRLVPHWNFAETQSDLQTLMELGTRHPDPRIRQATDEIIRFAVSNNHKHYAVLLSDR